MFKNYMPEVAKMLGVGIGEEFNIIDSDCGEVSAGTYKFTEKHLENVFREEAPFILIRLLWGDYTIEKLPWKPKEDEKYWFVTVGASCAYVVWHAFSYSSEIELYRLKMGNCFRTEEDANAGIEEVLAKLEEIRKEMLE